MRASTYPVTAARHVSDDPASLAHVAFHPTDSCSHRAGRHGRGASVCENLINRSHVHPALVMELWMGTEVGKVGGGSQGGWEVATADLRCEPLLSADTSGRAAVGLQHTLPSRPPATSTRAVSSF